MDSIEKIKLISIREIAEKVGIEDAEILTFRPEGSSIREYLMVNIISNLKVNEELLILDFDKIEACDVSCADEIVLELVRYLIKEKKYRSVVVKNVTDNVLENLRAAQIYKEDKLSKIQNSKVLIPFLKEDKNDISIIGTLESNLQECYEILKQRNTLTARELADIKKIAINSSSNRLKKLYDLGLIKREIIMDELGKYYKYKCINNSPN